MRKLAIAVALSTTVLAGPALARDGAWYVGGDLGATIVEDTDFDLTLPAGATGTVTLDHDYGFDASAFIGYDLGAFRLEAEVSYKRANVDGYNSTASLTPGIPAGSRVAGGGESSALSFMINGLLDFGDEDGLSGFIGGGAGVARVDFGSIRGFTNRPAFLDDSDTRFAWQAIAGVRQAVSRNVDVHLRYRFFNVEDVEVTGATATAAGIPYSGRFRSHSLVAGLTFNFGQPEPVAPPPPPPVVVVPPPPPPVEVPPPPPPIPGPFIIYFDWDQSVLTDASRSILDQVAAAYRTTGTASVVLAGHADRSGSASYNVGLSQRRANAARDYLTSAGVPAAALTTQAFGEGRPVVDTADGVREPQNRRVEITFGPGSGW